MWIALFGDVVGKPGREAVCRTLPLLREQYDLGLVVANVENIAHGFGITPETIGELQQAGVDIFTSGNHAWKNSKGVELLKSNPSHVLRPANIIGDLPGKGFTYTKIRGQQFLIMNLQGQVFMKEESSSPFAFFDTIHKQYGEGAITIVDFHAEATGEKRVFGWYADGRANIFVGTHTHVPTADEQILPGGTAYISDLGMCGATDSSLGMNKEFAIERVVHGADISLEPPEHPQEVVASGLLVEVNEQTHLAEKVLRIDQRIALYYT